MLSLSTSKRDLLLLLIIVLVAGGLRLTHLGIQSLWSGYRLFSHYAPQLDRRLYLENDHNPRVYPDVVNRMGGGMGKQA